MKKFLLPTLILLSLIVTANKAQAADFSFSYGEENYNVSAQTLSSWEGQSRLSRQNQLVRDDLSVTDMLGQLAGKKISKNNTVTYHFQAEKVFGFAKDLATKIDVKETEPALKIENNKAVEFTPPQTGLKVDLRQTTLDALGALERGRTTTVVTVAKTEPLASLTQLNDLGISELIAQGTSNFSGSPKNRIHNIQVGVKQMTGIIVMPGEEFSFNKYLGPVDGEHGFLPELVIKKTGTVPEFGGGLCQVSSTAFRAAMQAGLPITQRRNHAYAVQYYSPQGTDATIYPGVIDLKFVNDTPGAILIWPHFKDKSVLVFDFYGSKDSRQVTLEKPVQWDKKTDGSMKASWTRLVTNNGTTTTDTFKSTYLPPALFHKEETFVASTTPPATAPVTQTQ